MPLIDNGIYVDIPEENPYELEESYYLDFYISSALASIYFIMNPPADITYFDNNYQYYHFYTDHLLYSYGLISGRFTVKGLDQILDERVYRCRKNYCFSENQYPFLSNKKARNMVEHINEHNQRSIQKYQGVGGFNVIDRNTEDSLVNTLRNNRNTHLYTLDLLSEQIYIHREEKNGRDEDITIDLVLLKEELLSLQKSVRSFTNIRKRF